MEIAIDKIIITEEAELDYEESVGYQLPKEDIKTEVEWYIGERKKAGRFTSGCYFHVDYLDEEADKMVRLFFYKGEKFGTMQTWNLAGACLTEDWSEEMEDCGQIRVWLKTILNPTDKGDWVWDERVRRYLTEKENEYWEGDRGARKMIKELLKNYKLNTTRIKLGTGDEQLKEQMEFMDKCIDALEDEAKAVIISHYIKGQSLAKVGKALGYSKPGVQYKRDRAITMLELLYQEGNK